MTTVTKPSLFQTFTRNPYIPLRLRKKFGKMGKPRAGIAYTIPLFDTIYSGQTGNHIDNKIFMYGRHEAPTLRLLRGIALWQKKQGRKTVALDVGTNSGAHLLAVAKLCDQSFGFEPWNEVRKMAAHNLALNQLNTKIFDFGLSDHTETLPFILPTGTNHGIGSFIKTEQGAPAEPNHLMLSVRKGDDVMTEHNIVPTLIKIDTEGFERLVLTGLRETLKLHHPAIIFEYSALSRVDFDDEAVRKELFDDQYSFYGLLPSREMTVVRPFKPGERYENVLAWPGTAQELAECLTLGNSQT